MLWGALGDRSEIGIKIFISHPITPKAGHRIITNACIMQTVSQHRCTDDTITSKVMH